VIKVKSPIVGCFCAVEAVARVSAQRLMELKDTATENRSTAGAPVSGSKG